VQQDKLQSAVAAEAFKRAWAKDLDALANFLKGH
jgi:hypothetical protein